MNIGIHIEPQIGYSYDDIVVLAKASEEAGFLRFSVSDHLFGWIEGSELPSYEAWTIMALLTPQTHHIRLSTQMTCQSYRNPALLAKIVANLDNASNGRIDLGIGAGWKDVEYHAYGYPFPSAKDRVLQLREALQIINLLWTETRPTFEGKFYSIKEPMFLPKPIQKPRVPIVVGTEKLKAPMMEETAARYADALDFSVPTAEQFGEKKNRMRKMCERVGRDFDELGWSVHLDTLVLGEDEDDFEEKKREVMNQEWPHKNMTEEVKQTILKHGIMKAIGGPPETVIERLSKYKSEADIVTIALPMIGDVRKNGLDTIRILKERIVPRL